ncbi:MAG: GNAT family N-acetyltransferase [Desulfurococcaceae archaeon]|nr:GNAT family N-acetyltransferase [Desulfurococcaceae archaeon]
MMRVLSTSSYSFRDIIIAFSKLYRSNPTPPHCYLIYDLIYEPENTEVLVKLSENNTVDSYVLIWRGLRGSAVHIWGPSGCELLQNVIVNPIRPLYVELYDYSRDLVDCIIRRLRELGFKNLEIKVFYDMECIEETFKPSENEYLAIKLTSNHVELFREYMRTRGIELTLQEARELITKRTYYAVILNNEIISAAATCIKLPEIHIICDVYTKPEFRNKGYAKAVTSAVTKRAIMSSAIAHLCVEVNNEPAIRVYSRLGYRVVNTRPWIKAQP